MARSAPAGTIAWRREEERRPSTLGLPLFVQRRQPASDELRDRFAPKAIAGRARSDDPAVALYGLVRESGSARSTLSLLTVEGCARMGTRHGAVFNLGPFVGFFSRAVAVGGVGRIDPCGGRTGAVQAGR